MQPMVGLRKWRLHVNQAPLTQQVERSGEIRMLHCCTDQFWESTLSCRPDYAPSDNLKWRLGCRRHNKTAGTATCLTRMKST